LVARVGQRVRVQAWGLQPARYRLSLVRSSRRGATCAARLSRIRRASGHATFRARIPPRLGCYLPRRRPVARVRVRRGSYELVLCRPRGPVACDGRGPVARRRIRIR
jgi:hypothetical protein